MKKLKIKKLDLNAKIPVYATEGAACFDLYAVESVEWQEVNKEAGIYSVKIKTGLAFEIPKGYCVKIYPRSGWGFKFNIALANGTGIIDEDYRGEVMIKLIAFCKKEDLPHIEGGTRVAQACLEKVYKVKFVEVDKISDTKRGKGGFGSTGVK